ncbi:type II asparaginase [Geminicoccus flavidas]|uniref:type II asparaginase n=1 Tax=Geminicoccus flavidas TaxID=2506407 RepID=UPI00190F5BBD|nr:type II asparaginase [Geminicoccus flavidas]
MTARPLVHVLATGGTIAGAQDVAHGYTAGSFAIDALLAAVPGLDRIAAIRGEQLVSIGSQDMHDAVWLKLARRLSALAKEPGLAGIVVTHGTDTLEETVWFAELTVRAELPIVFTGAMRPATAIGADGPANLAAAVAVAVDPAAKARGVLVVMNDQVFAARDVYKTHANRVDAFQAPERSPLGTVAGGCPRFHRAPDPRPASFDLGGHDALPKVVILYAHAGMDRELIDAAVAAGAKGIVVAGVGNGNMTRIALDALMEAAERGIAVVRSTRLPAGAVLAAGEVDDAALGFVHAGELKPGKARVLLQLALLDGADRAAIQAAFDTY